MKKKILRDARDKNIYIKVINISFKINIVTRVTHVTHVTRVTCVTMFILKKYLLPLYKKNPVTRVTQNFFQSDKM